MSTPTHGPGAVPWLLHPIAGDGPFAVGGPNLVSGSGWDPAPLVFMVLLVALMRWSRIPLRAPALLAAVGGGLLIDLIADTLGVSFLTASALLILAFTFFALRRIPMR